MRTWLTVVCAIAFVIPAGTAWAQTGSERFEVTSLKAIRPTLVNVVSTLDKSDVAGAKEAMEVYDKAWNGVEVYVNFRYIDMYKLIEGTYQNGITKALNGPNPDMPALAKDGHAMLSKFDETVGMIEKAPPISPLFDDQATTLMQALNLKYNNVLGDINKEARATK